MFLQEEVPNIALLGSGGGERAMVGFLGSLYQMGKEHADLLDSILYLSGVSGSTWCMASLYEQPNWSTNLETVKQQMNEQGLSSLQTVHDKDPYPIYAMIDQDSKYKSLTRDAWCELTPHEAGYSVTGAFVKTSSFGCKFNKGTLVKTQPEMDMLYIQAPDVNQSIPGENERHFEDAGLLLNSPYFSVTRPGRKVDLIISLDFSAGDPHETVVKASSISKEMGVSFPSVDVSNEDPKAPKDFYVFKGHGVAPTVIHMPLFNVKNCGEKLEWWREKYSTFQSAYSPEMIKPLVEKAGENIANNKENLLKEIQEIIKQKKARRTTATQ
ncbi:cytosolic phospholipase A2 gamma-like [Aplochiton taeniatus]